MPMNARCHKEHALFNRLSSRRSTNNNNVSASASACSFCGSLSAEMATTTAASHTCGEMQRKNQNKMQANAQECETARDAETQAQTATAAVLSQRSCSQRWQRSLLSTSSSIAYAQIDSSAATAAWLVSCSAVVRRVGRVLWISFAHLTQLRARAQSFDLLLVCVCVCYVCSYYYCYLWIIQIMCNKQIKPNCGRHT